MRDVAGDNNGAGQRNRRLDRILAERLADIVHWLVEVITVISPLNRTMSGMIWPGRFPDAQQKCRPW